MRKKLLIVTEAALENPEAYPLSTLDQARVNGVYRTYESFLPYLEKNYDVELLTPFNYEGPQTSMVKGILRRNSPFSAPKQDSIRLVIPTARDIAKRIDLIAPDYIHIATEGPLGVAALTCGRKKNIPVSTAFHTNWQQYVMEQGFDMPFVSASFAGKSIKKLLTIFHSKSGAVMAATDDLKNELIEWGLDKNKIHIVSRGIDTDIFHPCPEESRMIAGDYVIYVGRLAPGKGVERFCELDTGNAHKIVVGTGPLENKVKKDYPDVKFLGFMQGRELANLYSGAKLFVLPSDTETFGMTVIEALACGTPVIALNRGGHQPILKAASGLGIMESDLQVAYNKAACNIKQFMPPHLMADFIRQTRSWPREVENFSNMLKAAEGRTLPEIVSPVLAAA